MTHQEYTVEWRIQLYASSAEDAANLARQIQLDPNNTANHFSVSLDGDEWNEINADLSPTEMKQ